MRPVTPPRPIAPPVVTLVAENLGASQISRFAFDPAVPGRVVACGRESRDGGRTWTRVDEGALRRAMVLGDRAGAPAAAGPDGRILCGDVILPSDPAPAGLGEIQTAAEWTGTAWRGSGLPIAARAGAEAALDVAVGYTPDGAPLAVRVDRVMTPGATYALPGVASAWAMDPRGTAYASLRLPSRRPHLMWAPAIDQSWQEVPSPGEVRALAVDGDRAYAAAEMLGRGRHGTWDWTRWPAHVTVEGVTARGATVVAWGQARSGDGRGGYVVSRDGGATLQLAIHEVRPIWAALDPHRPSELLVLGDGGQLTRLRIE
jgi:hypothetical protein